MCIRDRVVRVSLQIAAQIVEGPGMIASDNVSRYEWIGLLEETATTLQAWEERHAAPGLAVDRSKVAKELDQLAKQLRERAAAEDLKRTAISLVPQLDDILTYVREHPASQWS